MHANVCLMELGQRKGGTMLYISVEDFYEKVSSFSTLSRQEEIECAHQMKNGDALARERLICSYLPMVASHIKHASPRLQSLGFLLYCHRALEKAVDSFDFFQDSDPFTHRFNWSLRQATAAYIVR